MFSAKLVATTIALFTFAKASPVLQARSCSPNFQGFPLTIFKNEPGTTSLFFWQPTNAVGGHIALTPTNTPFAASDFLVAFSGQPDGSYVFKLNLNADTSHSLQMQGFASSDLSFQPIQFTGDTQNFLITCNSCVPPNGSPSPPVGDIADGCSIKHVETGLCVTDNEDGSTLTLDACTGSPTQQYNFHSP